jgi:hypothetical protein
MDAEGARHLKLRIERGPNYAEWEFEEPVVLAKGDKLELTFVDSDPGEITGIRVIKKEETE